MRVPLRRELASAMPDEDGHRVHHVRRVHDHGWVHPYGCDHDRDHGCDRALSMSLGRRWRADQRAVVALAALKLDRGVLDGKACA